jgi:hypothetical protein
VSRDELYDSVTSQADPEVDDEAEIELIGTMPGSWRQKRHEDQKIKCVATDDRDKGFCEVGPHTGLDTARVPEVASV